MGYDASDKLSQFPQFMDVVMNFVILPLSSLSEVCIGSCRFHAAAGQRIECMSVSYTCVAQYSPDHKALTVTCKGDTRVKPRV